MSFSTASQVYYDLIVVACSAGGLAALSVIFGALPGSFSATILVVQHLHPNHPTMLPQLLSHHSPLDIKLAEEHDLLRPGTVFIAPPNFHLLINHDRTLSLSSTPPVCYARPSADVLFLSAAERFHERAIAVVLTGTGKDGSAGVREIHQQGGKVIAQDRFSASFFSMPQSAILTGCVDYILSLIEIPDALIHLTQTGTHV